MNEWTNMLTGDSWGVDEVRRELGSLGHRPGHDGGCRGGEDEMEEPVRVEARRQVLEEEVPIADEGVRLAAEGEGVADSPVRHGADTCIGEWNTGGYNIQKAVDLHTDK